MHAYSPCNCVLYPQHVALTADGRMRRDSEIRLLCPSMLAMPPQKMETADVSDKKVVWCRYCDSAAGPLC